MKETLEALCMSQAELADRMGRPKNTINEIIKGKKVPGVNGKTSGTKSILLTPVWVTKKNYKLLFTDGFLKKSQVCVGPYAKFCK